MPIAQVKPDVVSKVVPNIPKITAPSFRGVVVDTKYQPIHTLNSYVEGSSWVCNYYSQITDTGNDVRTHDNEESAVFQQYHEILELVLKVTSPLTSSQDTATNRMSVKGSATIFSFLIPNAGDIFIADVGDGRSGVFNVDISEKKSILKDSFYTIEYTLLYFTDARPESITDLKMKSIKTSHYVRDLHVKGQSPIIIDSDFKAYREIKEKYEEIIKVYMKYFFSNEYQTFLVPGQPKTTYDPYVTNAFLKLVNTDQEPKIIKVRQLNIDDDEYLKQTQIWDCLMARNKNLLNMCNRVMSVSPSALFNVNPMLEGIYFSGIAQTVYPKDPNKAYNYLGATGSKAITLLNLTVPEAPPNIVINNTETTVIDTITLPIIKPISNTSYVLSNEFYTGANNLSLLERLVEDFINKKPINAHYLKILTDRFYGWGGLEQFYYLPLLLILINGCNGAI